MSEKELFFLAISLLSILAASATFMVNRWGIANRRVYEVLQERINMGNVEAFLLDTKVSFFSLHVTIVIQAAERKALVFKTNRKLEELGETLVLTHVFGNGYRIKDIEKKIEYPKEM